MMSVYSRILNLTLLRSRFVRFGIVGLSNTAIDFLAFCFFLYICHLLPLPSNVLAFAVAVTNSYFLNKYWSFGNTGSSKISEFGFYLAVSVFGLVINSAILLIAAEHIHILLAKILAGIITPLWNFFGYRLLFSNRAAK